MADLLWSAAGAGGERLARRTTSVALQQIEHRAVQVFERRDVALAQDAIRPKFAALIDSA
jgi:hypothetical protein